MIPAPITQVRTVGSRISAGKGKKIQLVICEENSVTSNYSSMIFFRIKQIYMSFHKFKRNSFLKDKCFAGWPPLIGQQRYGGYNVHAAGSSRF
jgi:hypothetical protein